MNSHTLTVNSWEVVTNEASRACTQPAVSVIITLFNYAAFIIGCLESVRATRAEGLPGGFEVVVVDDGSTDDGAKLVEEYLATRDLPVCLVKKKLNTGLTDSRNIGLQMARAPLVFILDADNEIRPECLQAHYAALAATELAAAYGHINRFDHASRRSLGVMSNQDWNVRRLVTSPCIDAMAMFRKATLFSVGGYSPEFGALVPQGWEDYDLWLKLAQAGFAGKMIPQVLSDYRVHPTSMIHGTNDHRRQIAQYFLKKFCLLVRQYDDTGELFGFSRRELAIAEHCGPLAWFRSKSTGQKIVQGLLSRKLCRSLCKRLASVYAWLYP